MFSTISQSVHARYKRRLENVQKQLSDEQEKNQELIVANQDLQTSNADLSSKLDALRNYADQIADLQQRLSTSQSEFNACSANLSIANFQLDRLNAVARDTSNQLNRSTGKVIELQSTVLNLSSLRDVLFDFINSIRSKFLPNLPSLAEDNFSSLSSSFLSELYRRIAPPWSGPDPRIAQLQVQVDELTEANQSYAREARSQHRLP